jgi:hypothetical protein
MHITLTTEFRDGIEAGLGFVVGFTGPCLVVLGILWIWKAINK